MSHSSSRPTSKPSPPPNQPLTPFTDVTGSPTATKSLLLIYDIFGYKPQTLQGCDLLASSSTLKVFLPDFLGPNAFSLADFSPDTPEKKQKLGSLFSGAGKPDETAERVLQTLDAIKSTKEGEGVNGWGILGYCWGGKVAGLAVQKAAASSPSPFKALGEVHPAMVDPSEAPKIHIPTIVLASKDEDAAAVREFEEKLGTQTKHVETFGDQIHGWLGARSDLKDKRVKEEYERGYGVLLKFFEEHV